MAITFAQFKAAIPTRLTSLDEIIENDENEVYPNVFNTLTDDTELEFGVNHNPDIFVSEDEPEGGVQLVIYVKDDGTMEPPLERLALVINEYSDFIIANLLNR